jgi:hypothetical protein
MNLFRKLLITAWGVCVAASVIMALFTDRPFSVTWLGFPRGVLMVAFGCVAFIGAFWSLYFLVIRRNDEACLFGFLAAALGMTFTVYSPTWGLIFLATAIWLRLRGVVEKKIAEQSKD